MSKDALIGRLIADRYRLIARLGKGGMAAVYLARHVVIERLNAIKLLHPDLAKEPLQKDRFLREARAVNRINHPNIVEILDYGESEGFVYLVMEYIPGEPLQVLLERGPLGWRRAAHMGEQIAAALGRAHQMGVIHRDLKPANVLVVAQRDAPDLIKLTDFGVAKVLDAPSITTSTIALGTPGYVAPEYRELGVFDGRSDLFSLGVVLYEATCGALPWAASSLATGPPPPLAERAPGVPALFDEVIKRLLARDPDDRPRDGFETAHLMRRSLEQASSSPGSEQGADPNAPSGGPGRVRVPAPPGSEPSAESRERESIPRRPGPRLATAPFDRVGPLCDAALSKLEAALGGASQATPGAEASIAHARRLVRMVDDIGRLVATDHEGVEALRVAGRKLRADLGAQLDEVARAHSKALGWASIMAERSDVVRSRRHSGVDPIPVMEAMVWEQAALEGEEDRAREEAGELAHEMAALQGEIGMENERLEHEMLVGTARLEGRVAALRSIALEAWLAMEDAAGRMGLSSEWLCDDA